MAMPTSSIFQQVVIETPEEAERFVDALWESYLDVTERGLGKIGKGYRMATRMSNVTDRDRWYRICLS